MAITRLTIAAPIGTARPSFRKYPRVADPQENTARSAGRCIGSQFLFRLEIRSAGSSCRKCCIACPRRMCSAGERMARGDNADHHQEARQFEERFLSPRRGIVEAPRQQVRCRHARLHPIQFRVERAQAHGLGEEHYAGSGSPRHTPRKSSKEPSQRPVGIKDPRPGPARQSRGQGRRRDARTHGRFWQVPPHRPCPVRQRTKQITLANPLRVMKLTGPCQCMRA